MKQYALPLLTSTLTFAGYTYLPDNLWDKCIDRLERASFYLRSLKKRLPFVGEIYLGEELLLGLQEAESKMALGLKILPEHLAQYKFYTALLEEMFELNRKMGAGLKKCLPELRRALKSDVQFERKLGHECISALLQFVLITTVTWSFVFLSRLLISLPLNLSAAGAMHFLQSTGLFFFFKLLSSFKEKSFAPFKNSIREMYLFSSLSGVGLSLNEVQEKSCILNGSLVSEKIMNSQKTRLLRLIDRQKETGLPLKEEAHEIINELWILQDEQFLKFTKKIQALKFGILAIFFLPAYFLYLASIFQFFMEQ